jgi:hypothetical protein
LEKISIKDVVSHLKGILSCSDDEQAMKLISTFQQWVWDSQIEAEPEAGDVLDYLALDLEYFDPMEVDAPFYGRSKLKIELESAIEKLQNF